MRAERIESSLHARSWTFNRQGAQAMRQAILLLDGTGEAEAGELRHAIAAPALLWLGDLRAGRARVEAGATGFRSWIANDITVSAIGDQPESVELRYLVDRNFVLSLAGDEASLGVLQRCFAAAMAEVRQPR